jgi:hypothetical protein
MEAAVAVPACFRKVLRLWVFKAVSLGLEDGVYDAGVCLCIQVCLKKSIRVKQNRLDAPFSVPP